MKYATQHREFFAYPNNRVYLVVEDERTVDQAIKTLTDMEVDGEAIQVLHGRSGEKTMDVTGENHGIVASVVRSLQQIADGEGQTFDEYEEELEAGRYILSIPADDRDIAVAIVNALKAQGARHAYYYTTFAVETMLE